MYDSDDDFDLQENNIFTYTNGNTTIYAKGPNLNNTNMNLWRSRNNVMSSTSTMHMPLHSEQQSYARSLYDQRSMYNRREMSPMSLRGASDFEHRNLNHSSYTNGMGSRSMYNGRGVSPYSVRSNESTATLADDIVLKFSNVKFDKHDMRKITEAYEKLVKRSRRRHRIEKRTNHRLLLKHRHRLPYEHRRVEQYSSDSDKERSDSSTSNDSRRSIRTHYNRNAPHTHFSTNIRDNQIVNDRTDNIKQNTLTNIFNINRSNYSTKELIQNKSVMKEDRCLSSTMLQNSNILFTSQKERFGRDFILPSQRFNKTVNTTIHNNDKIRVVNGTRNNSIYSSAMAGPGKVSNSEKNFREDFSQKSQVTSTRKRILEIDEINNDRKKSKGDSQKQLATSEPLKTTCSTDSQPSEFTFIKPIKPIRKNCVKKVFANEKILAKSRLPPTEEIVTCEELTNKVIEKNNNEAIENETHSDFQHSNSDISMRPSFIKRKLFTQKLDVTENKNVTCDNAAVNISENVYTEAIRRNRARKLVTSQSCLNKDIVGEDSHVLDLIQKIVPADQINATKTANKTDLSTIKSNQSKNIQNEDKWDVTSAILNSNNQDVSDTYTDEEIFNITFNKESNNKTKSKKMTDKTITSQCEVVLVKLNPKTVEKSLKNNNISKIPPTTNKTRRKNLTDCVKKFWESDYDSDGELNVPLSMKTIITHNKIQRSNLQGFTTQKKVDACPEPKVNNSAKKNPTAKGSTSQKIISPLPEPKLNNSPIKRPIAKRNLNVMRECKLNVSLRSQNNLTNVDKTNKDIEKSDPLLRTPITKSENLSKLTNKKHNVKKVVEKENVPVMNKKQESGRTPKVKKCMDCNSDQQQSNKTKNVNNKAQNKKNEKQLSQESYSDQSSATPETRQSKERANNKTKSTQNSYIRIQPKRKSKEKSFLKNSSLYK